MTETTAPAPDPDTEPAASDGAPEPDQAPEHVEPAEAVRDDPAADEPSRELVMTTPTGALTIRPGQTSFDGHQKSALIAIGIDTERDPQITPHVRPFMHMCQVRGGLDPWAREAYLIGRGTGNKRKFTMQVGIDGYRKIAASTGRMIRVKARLWTGADDDDTTWRAVDDGHGGIVMRRVWYDQWPASRGFPGAAKVVVEHYDDTGNVVESEGVADWGMYAPMTDKWEDGPNGRRKVVQDGEVVQTLNDMWAKGYAHMLGKCAEALAYRVAFPSRFSGMYTHEEMHRADQDERARQESEVRARRRAAYEASQAPALPAAAAGPVGSPDGSQEPGEAPAGPIPVGDVLPEVVATDRVVVAPEQRHGALIGELQWQASVLDQTVHRLAQRVVRATKRNVEDFTVEDYMAVVASLRPPVAARLRENGEHDVADRYETYPPTEAVDVGYLLGDPGEVVPGPDDADDDDPDSLHDYVDVDGTCRRCGLAESVGNHPEDGQ